VVAGRDLTRERQAGRTSDPLLVADDSVTGVLVSVGVHERKCELGESLLSVHLAEERTAVPMLEIED
jgi:hypothetical protein